MTAKLFAAMVEKARNVITTVFKLNDPNTTLTLVSGGAAWSDHVAVRLFIEQQLNREDTEEQQQQINKPNNSLTSSSSSSSSPTTVPAMTGPSPALLPSLYLHVFLPCAFNFTLSNASAVDTEVGRLMNHPHREFSAKLQTDTMKELVIARGLGAQIDCESHGFYARNRRVASMADYMLAFSFSEGAEPREGGTKYTWDRFTGKLERRIHVPLSTLV